MTGMITLHKNLTALSYGVNLNAEEKEYLKLPNSLTDFVNVNVESIQTEVKVMKAKLRMSVRGLGVPKGWMNKKLSLHVRECMMKQKMLWTSGRRESQTQDLIRE